MSNFSFNTQPKTVPKIESKFRTIKTKIPTPGTLEILQRLQRLESRSMHGQLPIVWNNADDFSVYDKAGNKWIDFTSTIFVANVGHSNKRVSEAIQKVLDTPLLSCYAYPNEARADYLQQLIEFAGNPFEKAFLLSAGTEATEACLKLMRMHGAKNGKRRKGIICIENNWHGRTMGAQLMGSNVAQKSWVGYSDNDIHHIPFPYPWVMEGKSGKDFLKSGLEKLAQKGVDIKRDVSGVMLETFQGWGALFYPVDFVKSIKTICEENNILLAFDEMQAGFGRTGKAFGFEHYGVVPDLFACGKGMGGGVPLAGVVGSAYVMDLPEVGNMSSTHSANPLVCAAGSAVISEIKSRELISKAARQGHLFRNSLEDLKLRFKENISGIYGHGMIFAILFRSSNPDLLDSTVASQVAEKCMEKGVLVVHTGRESIKLGPPLTISDDALTEGLEVIGEAISEVLDK